MDLQPSIPPIIPATANAVMLAVPLPHPCLDKASLSPLSVRDGSRWQCRCSLIGEETIFIPVVNCVRDEDKRLAGRADSIFGAVSSSGQYPSKVYVLVHRLTRKHAV